MPSNKPLAKIVEEYITGDGAMQDEKSQAVLGNVTRLTILSPSEPEVYYICQPSSSQQRMLPVAQKPATNPNIQISQAAKTANTPSASGTKWSSDDH